jgi:hypothetical protein
MNKFRITVKLLIIATFLLAFASITRAQATRTWVSGVGDDANPCSRTAPCKTFAGAISKTFINGEIDCLDEGGFGTVTITKSITLDGTFGSGFGSILSSGSPSAVLINVATSGNPNDPLATVKLRNLSITGTGASGTVGTRTGVNGIRILSAKNVTIENCLVTDYTNRALSDERSSSGGLTVSDSTFRNVSASAVVIIPGASASVDAIFNRCQFNNNGSAGLGAEPRSRVTVVDSIASNNGGRGFVAEGDATPQLNLKNTISSHNGTGVAATNGALVRLSYCQITNNTTLGLDQAGGTIAGSSDNLIAGNGGGGTSNGPPNGSVTYQ